MSKCKVMIGFVMTVETDPIHNPGVYKEVRKELPYYAEITKMSRRLNSSDSINHGIELTNTFTIIADPYARNNFYAIKYLTFLGNKWTVSSIDIDEYPKMTLSLGGLYNNV